MGMKRNDFDAVGAGRMTDSLVLRAYTRSGLRAECTLMQQ